VTTNTKSETLYAYIGLERNTKLIVGYMLGKREAGDTWEFAARLKRCTSGRFHLSTDGGPRIHTAMPMEFGQRIDYAQIVKVFKNPPRVQGKILRRRADSDHRQEADLRRPGRKANLHVRTSSVEPDNPHDRAALDPPHERLQQNRGSTTTRCWPCNIAFYNWSFART